MKKSLGILLILLAILLAGTALAETTTVMMYMCGTDLYEDCLRDMKEICAASYGSEVTVCVQAGGAKKWGDSRLTNGALNRFTIQNGSFSTVTNVGKSSMGKASTLSDFVLDCLKKHPADRYMLVLWDHGGGSTSGVCFDETANDDSLSIQEITQAMKTVRSSKSDFQLDIIGMDACLMATFEAADAMTPYADYLVASEELEPWLGWYYTPWLTALGSNPDMSTDQICINIVDAYMEACLKDNPSDYVTLSAINLKNIETLSDLSEQFFDVMNQALDQNQLATVTRLRQNLYGYGSFDGASSDMVDMDAFFSAFSEFHANLATKCREALKQCVLYCRKSDTLSVANGISVLIPLETASDAQSYAGEVTDGSLPNLVSFIKNYAAALRSGNYVFSSTSTSSCSYSDYYDDDDECGFWDSMDYIGFIPGCSDEWNDYCSDWDDWDCYDSDYCSSSGGFFNSYWNDVVSGSTSGSTIPIAGSAGGSSTDGTSSATQTVPIAGTSGTTPTVPIAGTSGASTVSASGVPIAGTATGTAVEANLTPPAPSFIAGTASGSVNGVYNTAQTTLAEVQATASAEGSFAYNLALTSEDMEHLSYVVGHLLLNVSDDEMLAYVDLGNTRDTWVDWSKGVAYSLFDGTWPNLQGQMVCIIDQTANGMMRRSLIPAKVNGEDTYLVVVFRNGEKTGEIIGYSKGYDSNGLPVRGVTQLKAGDEIIPVYALSYSAWDKVDEAEEPEEAEFLGDPIQWQDGMTVSYEALEGGDTSYWFNFILNDIYGDFSESDSIEFTIS